MWGNKNKDTDNMKVDKGRDNSTGLEVYISGQTGKMKLK